MIQTQPQVRSAIWIYTGLAVIAIAASLFLAKSVDFRVYWYGVHDFFAGTRPAYGLDSGIGYPLEYRYPPVTYLILYPLRALSLRVGGFVWMLSACTMGAFAVSLAVRVRRMQFSRASLVAASAYMLAYVVLAIRYGNVQPFVIAWLFMALALAETKPVFAGALLSLAVTFKIWPILFLPWLLHRTRWRAAGWFAVSMVLLWLSPLLVFGLSGYATLLKDWFAAVGRLGTTYSEFYYFPGQSLRGILIRYCTTVAPPLRDFPDIHLISVPVRMAIAAWGILGTALYCFFAFHMLRSDARKLWAWDGLIFILYSLLEPYAVKSGLISIGPAVITAACLYTLSSNDSLVPRMGQAATWANRLFLAASSLSLLQAILQYKPWQRFLLTIGLDFWAEVMLLAALFLWIRYTPVPEALKPSIRSATG